MKPLGGRERAAHLVSCVLCFFVVCVAVFGKLIVYILAWYYQFGGLFVPLFSRNNTHSVHTRKIIGTMK